MDLKGPYEVGPLSDDPVERCVQLLAARFTDPTRPENKLKRPTSRKCLHCGSRYRSTVSFLCDDGFCSEACSQAFGKTLYQYREFPTDV